MFRKVIRRLLRNTKDIQPITVNDTLIEQGVISVGDDTDIKDLKVYSHNYHGKEPNVIIGSGSQVLAQIELQSKDAKVVIGNGTYIGPGTRIFCRDRIEIGNDVMISWGCTILDTNFHSLRSADRKDDVADGKKGWTYLKWNGVVDKPIFIEDKSWVGFNTIITKGVTIAEGTVVGCGSVVARSTKKYTVVGGNPAQYIKDTE